LNGGKARSKRGKEDPPGVKRSKGSKGSKRKASWKKKTREKKMPWAIGNLG